jgi:hypothetical protein
MLLFGDANWTVPAWLDRMLPHLNVEGRAAREAIASERVPEASEAGVPEPVAG